MNSSTKRERWEARLKELFDELDRELEPIAATFGIPLHPARPAVGETANPEDDGLLDLGATFSLGLGSAYGPGYVLQCRIATLAAISPAQLDSLLEYVAERLNQRLPLAFPGKNLRVDRDGPVWKIHGDLSLDDA